MNSIVFGYPVLATKRFKKVRIHMSSDVITLDNIDFRPKFKNPNDLKSELLNHGYKINWDIFSDLLELWVVVE